MDFPMKLLTEYKFFCLRSTDETETRALKRQALEEMLSKMLASFPKDFMSYILSYNE